MMRIIAANAILWISLAMAMIAVLKAIKNMGEGFEPYSLLEAAMNHLNGGVKLRYLCGQEDPDKPNEVVLMVWANNYCREVAHADALLCHVREKIPFNFHEVKPPTITFMGPPADHYKMAVELAITHHMNQRAVASLLRAHGFSELTERPII